MFIVLLLIQAITASEVLAERLKYLIVIPQQLFADQARFIIQRYADQKSINVEAFSDQFLASQNNLDSILPDVIINTSNNLLLYHQAARYAYKNNKIQFCTKIQPSGQMQNTYFIGEDAKEQCLFLKALLQSMSWRSYFILRTATHKNLDYTDCLDQSYLINLTGSTALMSMENIVGRVIKPSGRYLIVASLSQIEQDYLESSLIKSKLNKKGSGLITIGNAKGKLPGILSVIDSSMLNVQDQYQEIVTFLDIVVNQVEINLEIQLGIWSSMIDYFQQANLIREYNYVIKNILEQGYQALDLESVSNLKGIYFEQSQQLPSIFTPIIRISLSNSPFNPTYNPAYRNSYIFLASFIAIKEVNQSNEILTNFFLETYEFGCGVTEYVPDFLSACIQSQMKEFGQAMIGPFSSTISQAIMQALDSLGIKMPHNSPIAQDPDLSSREQYPNFTRMNQSTNVFTYFATRFFSLLGWTHFSIVYQDSWEYWYQGYKTGIETLNLSICNELKFRKIPIGIEQDWFDKNPQYLDNVANSKCRPVILAVQEEVIYQILDWLYDSQNYLDKYVFVLPGGVNIDDMLSDPATAQKRKIAIQGQIGFANATFYGPKGQWVYYQLTLATSNSIDPSMCMYYDAAMLYSVTFDFMIRRGIDYENADLFAYSLRQIKFVGCTGTVMISKETNDRESVMYYMYQAFVNDEGHIFSDAPYIYNPNSSILIQEVRPPVWPLFTSGVPEPIITYEMQCGELASDIEDSSVGLSVFRAILAVVAVIGIFIFIIIVKFNRQVLPIEILRKQIITSQDMIVLVFPFADLIQLIGLGVSWENIWPTLHEIQKIIKHDYTSLVSVQEGGYQSTLTPIFALIGAWMLCVTSNKLKLAKFLSVFYAIDRLGESLLPVIGANLNLTLIQSLITIFRCDKGTGSQLQDSIHHYDCFLKCWKGEHLYYIIVSVSLILIYQTFSPIIYLLWQKQQIPVLKINFTARFIAIRYGLQMIYLGLWGELEGNNEMALGISQIALLSAFTYLIIRVKFCNYKALWFLYIVCMACCIALQILGTIYTIVEDYEEIFKYSAISVLLFSAIQIPISKKLYSMKYWLQVGGKDNIYDLFRFQLNNSSFPDEQSPASASRDPSSSRIPFAGVGSSSRYIYRVNSSPCVAIIN